MRFNMFSIKVPCTQFSNSIDTFLSDNTAAGILRPATARFPANFGPLIMEGPNISEKDTALQRTADYSILSSVNMQREI